VIGFLKKLPGDHRLSQCVDHLTSLMMILIIIIITKTSPRRFPHVRPSLQGSWFHTGTRYCSRPQRRRQLRGGWRFNLVDFLLVPGD
jgi:hypothetical protein